jgi:hypothetical protein
LYEVERWIADGKPLQLAPEAIPKGTRPKTALQTALGSGQHSLASLLLRNGYRLELERCAPLDMTLEARRWDLFDLLLEWGADLKEVDVYTVLNTYNGELYERFRGVGYDLTGRHEMASILGHGTSNRPLLGFVKRHRAEDPKIQQELNIALGHHVRAGNERGINLCLWAGADPHAPAPNPEIGFSEDTEPEDGEERFIGWSAIEEAASHGHLSILKRLGPDTTRDDFDSLYQWTRSEYIVEFLATMQRPRDPTKILASHLWWLGDRFPGTGYRSTRTIEAVLGCGVRWQEDDPGKLAGIRRSLVSLRDDHLKTIVARLGRPETCAPETYHELLRTRQLREIQNEAGETWSFVDLALSYMMKAFFADGLEQMLWHMVALEALFGENRGRITDRLSRRLASVYSAEAPHAMRAGIAFKKLYELRGELVHGRRFKTEVHRGQLRVARILARNAALRMLRLLAFILSERRKGALDFIPTREEVLEVLDFDRRRATRLSDLLRSIPPFLTTTGPASGET